MIFLTAEGTLPLVEIPNSAGDNSLDKVFRCIYTMPMEVLSENRRFESCAECTCFNLRKASRVITQVFDKALRPGQDPEACMTDQTG